MPGLLKGLPISSTDSERLVLELIEEMPQLQHIAQLGKAPLMQALRRVLREGVARVQQQEQTRSFAQVAEESLARRQASGRRPTTLRDLRHFIRRLLRVPGLAQRPLRDISTEECRRALEHAFAGSAHSFRKGRAIMHSIFAYGQRQQWCSSNPVTAIEAPVPQEKEIVPLSIAECSKLISLASTSRFLDCLPALGLMLFAGVRPGEVARLRWADVHLREGMLAITSGQSKTGGARRVELCPPLRRMLQRLCPRQPEQQTSLLCPPHWQKKWRHLRQRAGYCPDKRAWVPDVLRHTFASYHVLTHQNLASLQIQLGHRDSQLLRTRYLNLRLLRRAETAIFWRLLETTPAREPKIA